MPFRLASNPARPERANEDFAAAGVEAAVLLDGAGTPAGVESGCVHGVAWYARTLGGLLLAELAGDTSLPDALAASIERVSALHGDTCELKHADTPSATVVAVRLRGPELEYLVLADSTLVLDTGDAEPTVITDDRLATTTRELRAPLDATRNGTPEHVAALRDFVAALAEYRNAPGGFWVANTDPAAAYAAITGRVSTAELSSVALLSDGVTRLTDRFGLTTWRQTLTLLDEEGPAELIRQVREAEDSDPDGRRWPRGKTHDDATAVYWTPGD